MITTIKNDLNLIENKKTQLISIITQVGNIDILDAIENLLLNSKTDWWITISKSEQIAIDEGLTDIKNGNILTHQEVIQEIDNRFNLL
jgi:predicted transcriptional regulator